MKQSRLLQQNQLQKNKLITKIGNIEFQSCVSLAPMAGITDMPLRQLVRKFSPDCLLTTEMISSEMLMQNRPDEHEKIMAYKENEFPLAFQISGHKPAMMAKAAKILENKGASIIDINMGCPVKKVVSGGDGSALMRTPQVASDIVKSIKDAVSIPVTVKFRLGYTVMEQNFLEFAKLMEQSGADAMTIHCRTRSQMYSGKADWSAIADVKKEVKVPVFANGDILSPEDAKTCIQKSNTDGVAVGRGVLGAPDLIYRIEHYLKFGEILSAPSHVEKIQLLKEHINTEIVLRGEHVAIQFVRKFYPYYIKGIRDAAVFRGALVTENSLEKIFEILSIIEEKEASAVNE